MKMKQGLNAFWEVQPAYSVSKVNKIIIFYKSYKYKSKCKHHTLCPRIATSVLCAQGQQDQSNDDEDGDVYDHDNDYDHDHDHHDHDDGHGYSSICVFLPGQSSSPKGQAAERKQG